MSVLVPVSPVPESPAPVFATPEFLISADSKSSKAIEEHWVVFTDRIWGMTFYSCLVVFLLCMWDHQT